MDKADNLSLKLLRAFSYDIMNLDVGIKVLVVGGSGHGYEF